MRLSLQSALWSVLWVAASSVATAQPQRPPGPSPQSKPAVMVVTRVNVNVETDVDVDAGAAADVDRNHQPSAAQPEATKKPDLTELIAAVLKQPGSGSAVQVIADVNVNVATSIKVRTRSAGESAARSPEAGQGGTSAASEAAPEASPADAPAPNKKKRTRKPGKKPVDSPSAAADLPLANPARGIALNRLTLGERLEVGVSGQLATEQRARELADQINYRRNRALLGLALAGGFLPEQAESLAVVQKAVASVNAETDGSELSVSVAIPKETPGAVRTIVEAALRHE